MEILSKFIEFKILSLHIKVSTKFNIFKLSNSHTFTVYKYDLDCINDLIYD